LKAGNSQRELTRTERERERERALFSPLNIETIALLLLFSFFLTIFKIKMPLGIGGKETANEYES
jgi:hydrogenase-4 membrane subunit HyfE